MFTQSELLALRSISNGTTDADSIAEEMGSSRATAYSAIRGLRAKGILSPDGMSLVPSAAGIRLSRIMSVSSGMASVLSGHGMDVLMTLREPRTPEDVADALGISRATAYRRISDARSLGVVRRRDGGFVINDSLWPELRRMLDSFEDLADVYDPRAPVGSVIYSRDRDGVLYSNPAELDAQRAAFSLFHDYGVDIGLDTTYYKSHTEPQTIDTVFKDSLLIAE